MKYWLVRSPFKTRKWDDVLMAGIFRLYGIRNYAAKKNIAEMEKGDMALWYSSRAGRMIYGSIQVKERAFVDKTSGNNWLAIDFIPRTTFHYPVTLENLKKNKHFIASNILKQKRITVVEISKIEFEEIIKIATEKQVK